MATGPALPVAEAALFASGWVAIHGLRRHADRVTAALVGIAGALLLALLIACAPAPVLDPECPFGSALLRASPG